LIGFSDKFTSHNAFIAILLNSLEMLLMYLKKLKVGLFAKYQEVDASLREEAIRSSIEELEHTSMRAVQQF
jgi:hypothetical protein